jgi:hypothetical protein
MFKSLAAFSLDPYVALRAPLDDGEASARAPLDDGFFVFLILSHLSLSLFFSFFSEFREFKNLFFNYSAKPEGHARMKFLLKFTFASPPT